MKNEQPLISVIVPVYNVEKYLPACLESLRAQTWKNLEIILVDDGSTDGCPAICDAAAAQDARIRVVHQKNGGLSAARNAGVDAARGAWIGFVDSDDFVAPEMLETLYHAAAGQQAQMAVCPYVYVTPEGRPLPRTCPITKDEVLTREEALNRLSISQNWYYVTATNRLYRRNLFDRVRFPVGKIHEDEWTAHRFYAQCERVAVVAKPLYYYVQREGSIMRQESFRKRMDGVEGILDRAEFALEQGIYSLAFSSCNAVLGRVAYYDPAKKAALSQEEQQTLAEAQLRAERLIRQLLQVPGYRNEKGKVRLFLLSPALYGGLLALRSRMVQWKRARRAARAG